MAYTFNTTIGAYSSSTTSNLSAPSPLASVAAGDLIVVIFHTRSGATHSSVTDTAGNTYTQHETVTDVTTSDRKISMWSALPTGAQSNVTVTVTPSGGDDRIGIQVIHYSGITAYDASNVANQASPGTGTDGVTVSDTATAQPALVVGVCFHASGTSNPAAGTGFTDRGVGSFCNAAASGSRIEDKRITATGSVAATFTADANNRHISFIGVFTESAGTTIVPHAMASYRQQ